MAQKTKPNSSEENSGITTESVLQNEKDYVLHSWSKQSTFEGPVVVGGQGSWFWDADGKKYLDFASQAISNNAGHQHPIIVDSIKRQAEQICYAYLSTPPRGLLAKRIAELAPGDLKKTFFTLGGAEANENAIKIARYYTGKNKIIARWRSYHGASAGAIALTGDPRRWPTEPGMPGVIRALDCYCYRCPFGLKYPDCELRCANHIGEIIEMEGPNTVAAVFIETVVGSNGILVPPDGYLQRVREICNHYEVLLIVDEVMCGLGRTGQWFACNHWGVVPDIITLAKGLTSGYIPLGAVVVSSPIAQYFNDRVLSCGLTYTGHAIACAAGLATLGVYEQEGLIDNSRIQGEYMLDTLTKMKNRHPCIGDVRGLGLFVAVELVKDRSTKEPFTPFNSNSFTLSKIVSDGMKRGVFFTARWNFFMMAPPLLITREELDFGLTTFDELLDIADADLVR
jgi:taurine--2-oxoglutarate transaminase